MGFRTLVGEYLSFEEVEVLRRRAEAFLRNAVRLLREREYDLAIFNIEQYCQLILKYKLLNIKGSYLRTHSLRRFLRELGELKPEVLRLVNDVRNLHYIARIEDAYISSRYLPITFERDEVEDILKFVLEVFKPLVEKV